MRRGDKNSGMPAVNVKKALRALRLILNEGDFDAAVDFFVAEVFGDGLFAYIGD